MTQIKYPIGLQSFSQIREGGWLYVDKTEYIYQLSSRGKYYFLSRPRRFGKSLLISTIEEYFNGRRDLFEDLAICKYKHDWLPRPVLHLDLSGCKGDSDRSLADFLNDFLSRWESKYGIKTDNSLQPGLRFKEIILRAHGQTGREVVILVDEYDKPLLETIDKPGRQSAFREELRSFYSNLKSQDSHIHFAMLTGVTKLGHLSIFSDLNNLNDISTDRRFSGICGISESELHEYLEEGVTSFALAVDSTVDEIYKILKLNYDGYHFSPIGSEDIYNPFSLLSCIERQWIDDYWFRTGTPTYLIKLIKSRQIALQTLYDIELSLPEIENVSLDMDMSLYPVLYQSGYLTIKGYRPEIRVVRLGFPNREVEQGFFNQLMKVYISPKDEESGFSIHRFYDDVCHGNAEKFMERLKSLFADINHDGFNHIKLEQHYQNICFIVMKLLGFMAEVEYKTSSGRIDMVVRTAEYIYVFEFKMDKTAFEALAQINDKNYLIPFKTDGRQLVRIGANFSSADRNLNEWIVD